MRFGPDGMLWFVQGDKLWRISHPGIIGAPASATRRLPCGRFRFPRAAMSGSPSRCRSPARPASAIADVRGRRVRTLFSGRERARRRPRDRVGRPDDRGVRVPAGVYFGALQALGRTETRRIVLLSR
jgi:hypothetical protein